jgi:GT2 family glycosyltransferase
MDLFQARNGTIHPVWKDQQPMSVPNLSISIVSLNTCDLLRKCLASLYGSAGQIAVEVIVVDNHSNDATRAMLLAEFPQVRLIQMDRNEGYTRPMNLGLRGGQGRYLMQLNPDTVVQPGMLDALLAFMDAHPQVGICTPKVLNRDGSLQMQCRRSAARPWDVITYFSGLSKLFPHSRLFGRYLMTYMGEDDTYPVEAVSGSCMLIRRAVVEQIGYLDESYFAYQEDSDFCFRARQAGWEIYYVPAGRLVHFGGHGGSLHQPYQGIVQWHRSYYLYYRRHLAGNNFFLVNWLMYLGMGVKLVLSLGVNLLRREKVVGSRKP